MSLNSESSNVSDELKIGEKLILISELLEDSYSLLDKDLNNKEKIFVKGKLQAIINSVANIKQDFGV